MALQVGKNSYVTVEEADVYVQLHYRCEDIAHIWRHCCCKEAKLLEACEELEGLPFPGFARRDQGLLFPRFPSHKVPEAIKAAQIEIALYSLKPETQSAAAQFSQRQSLQKQGVKSFSVDDISETYTGAASMETEALFLLDARISRLLSRYLNGGYATC